MPRRALEAGEVSTDALDADELAHIFRARLEVHPEVRGFRLERRPRGLAPSPGVDEFHGRGVFELETELVAMERFGDDRGDRGDIPVLRARALDGTFVQGTLDPAWCPASHQSGPRAWRSAARKSGVLVPLSEKPKKKPKVEAPKSQVFCF